MRFLMRSARRVEKTGARYVMLLDEKSYDDRTVVKFRYKEEDWVGIESITQEHTGVHAGAERGRYAFVSNRIRLDSFPGYARFLADVFSLPIACANDDMIQGF